ncbi:MAG: TonB-dependent siderophore receptor [Cyanobacteria bacterium P01_C01_bin.118]
MIKLWQGLLLAGTISVLSVQTATRAEVSTPPLSSPSQGRRQGDDAEPQLTTNIPQLTELDQPATTVDEWLAQTPLVQITDVRLAETETGLQVVLETADGELPTPTTSTSGDALILEFANTVLAGEAFEAFGPAEGIAVVQVSTLTGDRVQVAITGTDTPPVAEVNATGLAVTLGVAVEGTDEDILRIAVTGEQDEGYNPSNASTATRTDTPIRDIPFSIQVVPQQVLEDRNVRTITEAVETVSGVVEDFRYFNSTNGSRRIRGFTQNRLLRNGFFDTGNNQPLGVVEQVEVLKGPASVITGALEPGGIINYVTKQPLDEPFYELGLEVGNYGLYQPSVDLSGPLTADENVLYRFIASYESRDSFQDFANSEGILIAPSLAFNIGERTDLALYYQYSRDSGDPYQSGVPLLSDGSLPDRDFFPTYPDFSEVDLDTHQAGYALTHEFNENWQIRNSFSFTGSNDRRREIFPFSLTDDRFLNLGTFDGDLKNSNYNASVNVVGEFGTGSLPHQLLAGFDFNYLDFDYEQAGNYDPTIIPPLDIFDPDYDALTEKPEVFPDGTSVRDTESYGVYLQDQIAFNDQLKLLIGGRYDWITQESGFILPNGDGDVPSQSDGAFSPRIGLVYQPSDTVSLYGSYVRSFNPVIGQNPDNEQFEPTRGTQYEIGVKTDFLDGRLSATLAAYYLTKTNILTPDPDPVLAARGFSVQVGEQRSRGIELDVTGEILPGWNIIASYALTDTAVTKDNRIPGNEGNRFANVPEHQASLWTTYEIQESDLEGLGFGLGLFYVGERQGNLANSFQVGDYLRTDAALYYRRNQLNAAINIRNLFDIDYVGSVNNGNGLFTERGDPFTIVGSVSWEF